MNRSLRAPESPMQDAFKQRQQQLGALRCSPRLKDREDELALFLEMRNRDKERSHLLLRAAEDFDAASPVGSNSGNSPLLNVPSTTVALVRKTGADDFLNLENDKNDYDWLLTPPGTPLFPSLEMETSKTDMSQLGAPTVRPTPLKARFANSPSEHTGRSNVVSKQPPSSPGLTSSGGGIRRPSSTGNLSELTGRSNKSVTKQPASSAGLTSSGGGIRRPSSSGNLSEYTGRSNLVSKQPTSSPGLTSSGGGTRRPSSSSGNILSRSATPARRSTLTTVSKSSGPSTNTTVSKSSRPSTPTSQITTPSTRMAVASSKTSVSLAKPMVSAPKTAVSVTKITIVSAAKTTISSRSSTPLSRSTARSSTPTTRPISRAPTPMRRASAPPNIPTISSPSVKTSSISKSAPVMSRQPVQSHGTSPTVKSRPWKPSEMPGYSLDAPPNLRTTLPERPLSTTRGRPGAPSPGSSSVEPASGVRPRRQSCSPSRGRSSNGISRPTGGSMPAVNRAYSKANDNVSPVVMGTKMVERVINMRKLAPPRLDDKNNSHNLSGKSSSSPDSSGFGRSLSKKSLDMAIRHMDIRRRAPGDIRPSLMSKVPASSLYSVRSGPQRSRAVSISGSTHVTSSNASSEVSVNQNGLCLDNSEIDDDIVGERSGQSSASVRDR